MTSYQRALIWAALDLEQHWRSASGVLDLDEEKPGFRAALKQVIDLLRRAANRVDVGCFDPECVYRSPVTRRLEAALKLARKA